MNGTGDILTLQVWKQLNEKEGNLYSTRELMGRNCKELMGRGSKNIKICGRESAHVLVGDQTVILKW